MSPPGDGPVCSRGEPPAEVRARRSGWLYKGQQLAICVTGLTEGRQVAVVDLATTGEMQLIYPRRTEAAKIDADDSIYLPTAVDAPFGAGHAMVLSAKGQIVTHLTSWLQSVQKIDRGSLLSMMVRLQELRVGLPLFTWEGQQDCRSKAP